MTDILGLIDGALRDYGTSTDAMRWTPEPTADEHPIDGWLHATHGGVTSAEAMEASERIMADLTSEAVRGIGRATETVTLDNRAGRFTVPPGHVRIECGDEVVYEGPIGAWPPVRPARPLPMCDGGEMVMVTDVGAWLRGGTAGERVARGAVVTVYRASERGNYVPPDCPRCGVRVRTGWVNVGTSMDLDRWMPGRWECPTPDCRGGVPDDPTPLIR